MGSDATYMQTLLDPVSCPCIWCGPGTVIISVDDAVAAPELVGQEFMVVMVDHSTYTRLSAVGSEHCADLGKALVRSRVALAALQL